MTIGSSHSAQELAGWTSALRKRRWENSFQCEYDKSALKTLQANETTSREYAYDLKNVSVEKVREILNANAKDGDLVTFMGGVPCQSFSSGGKRKALDDPRGDCLIHYLELAVQVADYIVLEMRAGYCPRA